MKLFMLAIVMDRKWLLPLLASTVFSIVLFLVASLSFGDNAAQGGRSSSGYWHLFVGRAQTFSSQEAASSSRSNIQVPPSAFPEPPKLAYLISGGKGDGVRMKRLLQALYHPRNQYVLHLDLEAAPRERVELARYVKMDPTFSVVNNVHVIGKANLVTYRGPTMVACTLHAAAILLRQSPDWDWFINLSASDYPLVTQDDLLHVLSYIPRDMNFIEHTSDIGWKEFQRAKPIIVDPGLYLSKKHDVFWTTQRRSLPTAFKLFTGSAWVCLSRAFTEYCVMGWDNLPRTLLMYYANFISSPEGYFHTVICNSQRFRNTTVNHDLHYIAWDNPPKQHPLTLTSASLPNLTSSGAPFARKFSASDSASLDAIDAALLSARRPGRFVPGGWCLAGTGGAAGHDDPGGGAASGADASGDDDPCRVIGDTSVLRPGPGAKRLQALLLRALSPKTFRANQCRVKKP